MSEEKDEVVENHDNPDPHFEPLVSLPQVQTKTLEEDEDELLKIRCKLYRYDTTSEPPEWKERGVGDLKILCHKTNQNYRVLMRRDRTLKICANHYILPQMELRPNCGSDRAFVWTTPADFADEEPKQELLAVRFGNAENAQKFKEQFEDAKMMAKRKQELDKSESDAGKKSGTEEISTSSTKTSEEKNETDEKSNHSADDGDKQREEETVIDEINKLSIAENKPQSDTEKQSTPADPQSTDK